MLVHGALIARNHPARLDHLGATSQLFEEALELLGPDFIAGVVADFLPLAGLDVGRQSPLGFIGFTRL